MAETGYTPTLLAAPGGDDAERQRRLLAQALLQQGMEATPIRSPWQGVARMAQAALGGWDLGRMDKERAGTISGLKSGFGDTQPPTPAQPAEMPSTALPVAAIDKHEEDDAAPAAPAPMPQARPADVAAPVPPQEMSAGLKAPGFGMAISGMGAPGSFGSISGMGRGMTNPAANVGGTQPDPFANAVNRTMQFEGGYVGNDAGKGPTNFGINSYSNPDINVRDLTPDGAKAIYKERYWNAINGDQIAAQNPELAKVAFDTAVNSGPGKARELLAASGGDPNKFLDLRQAFLNSLVENNPEKFGQYQKAWNNRISGLRSDIGGGPSMVNPAANVGAPATPQFHPNATGYQGAPSDALAAALLADQQPKTVPDSASAFAPVAGAPVAPKLSPASVTQSPAPPAKTDGTDAAQRAQYVQAWRANKAQGIASINAQMAQIEAQAKASNDESFLRRAQPVYAQLKAQRDALAAQTIQTAPDGRLLVPGKDGTPTYVDTTQKELKDPEKVRLLNAAGISASAIPKIVNDPTHPQHNLVMGMMFGNGMPDQSGKVVPAGAVLVGPDKTPIFDNRGSADNADPETVETLARRVYLGDQTALQNLGRGAQSGKIITAVQKRVGQIAQEVADYDVAAKAARASGQPVPPNPLDNMPEREVLEARARQAGNVAGARTSGNINAKLDIYNASAAAAVDLALEKSNAVPRTGWVPFNKAMLMMQAGSGNPDVSAFVAANNTLVNEYDRAVSGGVGTVSGKEHAREMLNTAQTPEQYREVLKVMKREMDIAHKAARGARDAARGGVSGDQGDAGTVLPPATPSKTVGQVLFGNGTTTPAAGTPAPQSAPTRKMINGKIYENRGGGAADWHEVQ